MALVLMGLPISSAVSQMPRFISQQLFNYRGKLTDAQGNLLAGQHKFEFNINYMQSSSSSEDMRV